MEHVQALIGFMMTLPLKELDRAGVNAWIMIAGCQTIYRGGICYEKDHQ